MKTRPSPMDTSRKDKMVGTKAKTEWAIRLNAEEANIMTTLSPLAEKIADSINGTRSKGHGRKLSIWRSVADGPTQLQQELETRQSARPSQFSDTNLQWDLRGSLTLAVILRSAKMVRLLLEHGAGYEQDDTWYSPVIYAVDTNQADVLDVFIELSRQNVDKDTSSLGTVLHAACRTGNLEVLERLLNLGSLDVNACSAVQGFTPLQTAVACGHLAIVERLIDAGADVNLTHKDDGHMTGRTALHYAAARGDLQILKCLLASGAHRNIVDLKGVLPLVVAANSCHLDCFDALVDGVDLDQPLLKGETLLHYACYKGYNILLKQLLDKGTDPSVVGSSGRTPLMEAVRCGKRVCVKVMSNYEQCRRTVNLVETISEGIETNCLRRAFVNRDHKLLKLLIAMGADVNSAILSCGVRETLLISFADDFVVVEFLLKNGADPNYVTDNGETFISRLVKSEDWYLVHQILDKALRFNLDIDAATLSNGTSPSPACLAADATSESGYAVCCLRTMLEAGCEVTQGMRRWASKQNNVEDLDDDERVVLAHIQNSDGPRSLQELSRLSTLRLLPNRGTATSIDMLFIPQPLKDYLKIEQFSRFKAAIVEYDI